MAALTTPSTILSTAPTAPVQRASTTPAKSSGTMTIKPQKTTPNPPIPVGPPADMIMRGWNAGPAVAGQYWIYDLGSNSILAAYSLGQVGTNWAFVTLGSFFGSDTTDMLFRNGSTGGFEVY